MLYCISDLYPLGTSNILLFPLAFPIPITQNDLKYCQIFFSEPKITLIESVQVVINFINTFVSFYINSKPILLITYSMLLNCKVLLLVNHKIIIIFLKIRIPQYFILDVYLFVSDLILLIVLKL